MKRIVFLTVAVLMTYHMIAQTPKYLNPQVTIEERISDALSRMTLQEKIKLVHAQSKFTSAGVPRLGIRQLNMDDGPHGVREELDWNEWKTANWTNDSIVAFPSLTCLAATWNPALASLYGYSVSEEFAFRGKDVMLGPGVNIQRTPLNGRAFEYMGEDPYLASEMVVPYIQAVQANGVGCCLKHFALNNQETDRFSVNVNVSERALREIYLPAFEQAVKRAHVWTIMGSYNLWQNVHCSQNDVLLNRILKQEWGFDGALVSDWNAVTDTWQAATGGLDIEMGTERWGRKLNHPFTYDDYFLAQPFRELIQQGKLSEDVLNEKVRRVLRTIFRTSMNPQKVIGSQCSEAHFDACRQIAEEGIVLLKNSPSPQPLPGEGRKTPLLPLTPEKLAGLRVLIVGENATRSLTLGGGSSELKTLQEVSPFEALQQTIEEANQSLPSFERGSGVGLQGYTSGRAIYDKVDEVDPAEQQRLHDEAIEQARQAHLIIYIGGMNKNHRQDCENGDREDYNLSFGQNQLIADLAALPAPMVVVTFGGNPYAMPWLNEVEALVHCWYLGSESGTALANVLTGKVNPSGKLPVTFARQYEDYPYVKYGQEAYPGINKQVHYREGVFVGYRGFEKNKKRALFPFGYGLSYTTFRYGKPQVSSTAEGWQVEVDVTNTGSRDGKEVVQLYLGEEKPSAENPVKELRGFQKISLRSGETTTVRFTIARNSYQHWSETAHAWQPVPGNLKAYVCSSAEDVRGSVTFK